jgi:hypothetical protein
MAAFFTSHVVSPAAAPRRASFFASPRANRRQSIYPAAIVVRAAAAAGETLFALWTLLALAFSLLVMGDFLV